MFNKRVFLISNCSRFLEQSFRKNIPSVLELLSLDTDSNFRIREQVDSEERDERWHLTQVCDF